MNNPMVHDFGGINLQSKSIKIDIAINVRTRVWHAED